MGEIHISLMALGILMLAMGLAGEGDYQSEKDEVSNYCEMVDLFLTSGGENGWPAYRGTDECED